MSALLASAAWLTVGSAVLAQDLFDSGGSDGGGGGGDAGTGDAGTAGTGTAAGGGTPGIGIQPGWTVTPSVSVDFTVTDNVDLDPDGQEEEALITTVSPGISVRSVGPRFTSSYDVSLAIRQQSSGDDQGLRIDPTVVGSGTAELWKNRFFVDSSSSVSRVLLDSSQEDSESNQELVQTNTITPRWVQRIGNLASSQLAFTYQRVDVSGGDDNQGGDDANDTESMGLTLTIENGSLSPARLGWSIVASASESETDGDADDVERREIRTDLEFFVIRSLSLLGSFGYQTFDDGDASNDVDDITWNAGVHWQPGSRTDFRLTYGQRDNDESFNGSLSYQLGASTRVNASYSEVLQTGEEEFVDNLTFLETDPDTGALIDSRTGLPFSGDPSATSSDSDTARVRTFRAALVGSKDRDSYSISAVVSERDESGADDESSYGVSGTYGRALSPRANLGFDASFQSTEFDIDGQEDEEYSVGATWSYQVFENVSAFSSYTYRAQDSNVDADEFTENRLTIGAGMTF